MLEKVRYRDSIRGIDVHAYTDGYAYDEYSNLYLLSAAGYDNCVRAITSALLTGRSIKILSRHPFEVSTRFGRKYRILSSKLPTGLCHQILLEEGFFPSSDKSHHMLYVETEEDAPRIVYDAIKRSCPVPLIPEWSEWLYKQVRNEGDLEELSGTRKVIRLGVDEESLACLVSEGVRSGELVF